MLNDKFRWWLARRGIKIITRNSPLFDPTPKNVEPEFSQIFTTCRSYSMTSFEAQHGLFRAAEYVTRCHIPGDFVECGVYKGGSTMVAAFAFQNFGDMSRKFYLYDTFEGMTTPTERDVDFAGRSADEHLAKWGAQSIKEMALSPIEEVRRNLALTKVAADRFILIKGKVEDTLPSQKPDCPISILRLDTDWYESTRHELVHLFPLVSSGGVIIVDDYGFWRGSREACDEYFRDQNVRILLNRIDTNGVVIGVKS